MSLLNQKTIKKNINIKGVGLHSGLVVNLTIKPSEANTGIVFKRIDLNLEKQQMLQENTSLFKKMKKFFKKTLFYLFFWYNYNLLFVIYFS